MSQIVACHFAEGLLLAADRRVVIEKRGDLEVRSVCKLNPLGSCAALATSGAAVGIAVSRTLSHLMRRRATPAFEDLVAYALSVFEKEYADFVSRGEQWFAAHPEAHRLSYLLLGGRVSEGRFAFRFYGSEAHHEPYRLLSTGNLLTAPRRLGLEGRLSRISQAGGRADQVYQETVAGLRTVAARDGAVAGPFDVAIIDRSGVRLTTVE